MTIDEILECFKERALNEKTNNMIIICENTKELVDSIPDTTRISYRDDNVDIDKAHNIKIDLSETSIKDIFKCALKEEIPFDNKFSILKFCSVLSSSNKMIQLILYNMEDISVEDQMLLNELYYYNSSYYNVTAVTNTNFKTYFLTQDRVLDNRENFQKYEIIKPYTLTKKV